MSRRVVFEAYGRPQPAGSKRAFPIRRKAGGGWVLTGGVAVTDDNPKAKPWQADVADVALAAMMRTFGADFYPMAGPVALSVVFTLKRPKGHFGTGRNARDVKASAPAFPCVKPDTTKLLRAVEDACTGIVWNDDAQVIEQSAMKSYGTREGVRVAVWEL
jgi:Holliday junction resolvase RusA-like endonuclease